MKLRGGAAFAAILLAGIALASPALTSPAIAQHRGATPGDFDHYVLSLSWSPSYCASSEGSGNSIQCSRPYAFLVHGLWPQYHRGYPEFCSTRQPDRVPDRLVRQYLDIIPSPGLIGHQWRKHGSCSGLDQRDYLQLAREAWNKVRVPDEFRLPRAPLAVSPRQVEQKFIAANKGLRSDAIAVTCDRRNLREVRICLSKDLSFVPCDDVDRKSCRLDRVVMPPVRPVR